AVRIRIDLANTGQSVTLDGEIKWLQAKEGENLYEFGVGFQNLRSPQILALLRHFYGQDTGIPSSIA
ncbi:MAG: PilZ domain-containing protein, partial [Candidatus Aminicenantes bacterium]|nr:PilZ domain-containing protein [Candidatus Aminicenantes bacterium]